MNENAGRRVVVLDDDALILKVVKATLERRGLIVEAFDQAREGLQAILDNPPDVVLTDFQMPNMSGTEVINEIQRRLAGRSPPCLVLSANPSEQVIAEAYSVGAGDYICKPVVPGELTAKVLRALADAPAPRPFAAEALETVGPYEVVRKIGAGGMGVILEVRDADGRKLALKMLGETEGEVDNLLRFQREIGVLSTLRHPNLVRFHGAGKHDGRAYYTMDYIAGDTLYDLMRLKNGLPDHRVARILYQIGGALGELHRNDLLHRDVTPGNILIDSSGGAMLVDFGLAKHRQDLQLTASRDLLGTPRYMAPEHILGRDVDGRADLFSLGMVGLSASLGRSPVADPNHYVTMRKILKRQFPTAAELEIGPELAPILDRLTVVDPNSRTPDAETLQAELVAAFPSIAG